MTRFLHSITPVEIGVTVAVILFTLLCLHLTFEGRARREADRRDSFTIADQAPIHDIREEDQFVRDMRAAAAEARHATTMEHTELSSLPSADARTAQFAALAGDDIPDTPRPVVTVPAVDDYITGEIVAYREPQTQTDLTTIIADRLDEMHNSWHWVGGKLCAPTALIESLHADDWLRQLVETELVPA